MSDGELTRYERLRVLAQLHEDVVLPVGDAAAVLGGERSSRVSWLLREVGACGQMDGDPVVRWGDVVAAIGGPVRPEAGVPRDDAPVETVADAAEVLGVSTSTVYRVLQAVPVDRLPENVRPTRWGSAKKTRTRWKDPAQVQAWWSAANQVACCAEGSSPTPQTARRSRRRPRTTRLLDEVKRMTASR